MNWLCMQAATNQRRTNRVTRRITIPFNLRAVFGVGGDFNSFKGMKQGLIALTIGRFQPPADRTVLFSKLF